MTSKHPRCTSRCLSAGSQCRHLVQVPRAAFTATVSGSHPFASHRPSNDPVASQAQESSKQSRKLLRLASSSSTKKPAKAAIRDTAAGQHCRTLQPPRLARQAMASGWSPPSRSWDSNTKARPHSCRRVAEVIKVLYQKLSTRRCPSERRAIKETARASPSTLDAQAAARELRVMALGVRRLPRSSAARPREAVHRRARPAALKAAL